MTGFTFPVLEVEHLVRNDFDHAPMLKFFSTYNENITKSFRFFNFWFEKKIIYGGNQTTLAFRLCRKSIQSLSL